MSVGEFACPSAILVTIGKQIYVQTLAKLAPTGPLVTEQEGEGNRKSRQVLQLKVVFKHKILPIGM